MSRSAGAGAKLGALHAGKAVTVENVSMTGGGGTGMRRRRRVSEHAQERYAADQGLAARYPDLLEEAQTAERQLREAQHENRSYAEIRRRSLTLDNALAAALSAAEAAERSAMGAAAYDDRIAARKALARTNVRLRTDEADRLRTLREAYRLESMGRAGTLVPSHVQVGTYAVLGPHISGVDMADVGREGEELAEPRIGVDLDRRVGQKHA